MKKLLAALIALIAAAAPLHAGDTAFRALLDNSGGPALSQATPGLLPSRADGGVNAVQYLPPDNDEPGFEWPGAEKGLDGHFFYMGKAASFLKVSEAQANALANGTGKCALAPKTAYKAAAKPGFRGEHMTVTLAEPLPGCQLTSGYIFMSHVSSSSAGGAWELPRTVRAFLDTLAYAEGTEEFYNLSFTFKSFSSYADHPRKVYHSGNLYSSAAGRYQFLPDTWDGLAPDLGLTDFTPPSQDKAVVETIRRSGAYNLVLKSSKQENFNAALSRLNGVWASLPGSPYGQPTHSSARLWVVYRAALAKY